MGKTITSLTFVIILSTGLAYGLSDEEKFSIYSKGEEFFMQGEYEKALEFYEEILAQDKDYADAIGAKGAVHHRLGNYEKALEFYDLAISIEPRNHYFLNDRGNALLSLGKDVEAEKDLKKSLEIFPEFIDSLNGMANIHSFRQNFEKEIEYRKVVLILEPENNEALTGAANAFMSLKNYEKAEQYYDKVLEINPNYINAIIGKANLMAELKQNNKALEYYESALMLEPNNKNALKGKSIVLVNLAQYEEAIKINEKIENSTSIQDNKLPPWINYVFEWFKEEKISQEEVIEVIRYLINKK